MTKTATHNRRSIRLQGYDYSQAGAYFVTICTQSRKCLFGDIVDGKMQLNDAGRMIQQRWDEIPKHYPGIDTDEVVIMPNHIHGIIVIVGAGPRACPGLGQPQGVAPTRLSLPDVVHRFKSITTKRYTDGVKQTGWLPFPGKLWQRNYWEHVVRNEQEMDLIRQYIHNNPAQWELDKLYVGATPRGCPNPGQAQRHVRDNPPWLP
jgi:putative transposase